MGFWTLAAVKQCKTSGANMRIALIGRITIKEAHVQKAKAFGVVYSPFLLWRSCTYSSVEELHLTQTEENPTAALAELRVRRHNDNTPQLKLTSFEL